MSDSPAGRWAKCRDENLGESEPRDGFCSILSLVAEGLCGKVGVGGVTSVEGVSTLLGGVAGLVEV